MNILSYLFGKIPIDVFIELQSVFHQTGTDMHQLLPRGQKYGDHLLVHIAVDIVQLIFVIVIRSVAYPAHVKTSLFAPQQIDQKPVVRQNFYIRTSRKYFFQKFQTGIDRKQRLFIGLLLFIHHIISSLS